MLISFLMLSYTILSVRISGTGVIMGQPVKQETVHDLPAKLDRMKNAGIDNLRILEASEASHASDAIRPAIQTSPGIYKDSLLTGLDFFLFPEMNKRDMRAVIFLNNYWTRSGGITQYNK